MEFLDHPGAMLAETHGLDDGSRVRLRLTRPTDLPRIAAFLDSEAGSRRFAFYDPRERLAIAATRPGAGGEEIVGLAEVDLDSPEPDVIVADEARRSGLRRLLAQAGAALARQRRHG